MLNSLAKQNKHMRIKPGGKKPGNHVVTVLLHDYFHRGVFKQVIGEKQWSRFESRLDKNVNDTLSLLKAFNIKATFFTLGWIADNYPEIIKRLVSEGHEIANAGYWARSATEMKPEQLIEDLLRSKEALERAGSNKVIGYRCAYQWFHTPDFWVLDILAKEGYVYDASFRPPLWQLIKKSSQRFSHIYETKHGEIWEFPTSTSSFIGLNLPIAGGSYLRLFPHFLMLQGFKKWCKETDAPFVLYFHPWELDTQQPVINAAGKLSKICQYRNLGKMEWILPAYFREDKFQSISQYLKIPLEYPDLKEQLSPRELDAIEIKTKPERDASAAYEIQNVSVVIPCYNESSSLLYLSKALDELKMESQEKYTFKFILVDDCSKDDTYTILNKLFGVRADCKVLKHEKNMGVAAALKTGIIEATNEIVCTIDADCSYDPLELSKMIPLLEDNIDMVTASPYHRDGFVFGVPRWRLCLSKTLSKMYHFILRHKLSTYTSCFRVYRRSSVLSLPCLYGDFRGIIEQLALLDIQGGSIREYPTTLQCRIFGHSKMKILKTIAGHLKLLLEIIKYQRKSNKKSF